MFKTVILVPFLVCYASSAFLFRSEIPVLHEINGIEVKHEVFNGSDIPTTPNDTENVLYRMGERREGDKILILSYGDHPEDMGITKVNETWTIPSDGSESGCVFRAIELFIGQRPMVDQGIRMLAGGVGRNNMKFSIRYENMVRSFSYFIIYGRCDSE